MLTREFVGQTAGQNWHYVYRGHVGVEFMWHYHPEFELTLTRGARGTRYLGSDVTQFDTLDLVLVIEALNFQITVAIGFIISYILMGAVIGVVLLPLVGLASLIFSIMGATAENQNRPYTYPFSIKIVKK